ncbi:TPA: type I methionyl aminopeptidase [Vibrio vulnificus]|nr:type I methionyl aminopeptidase [Vibrio vulnificus]
MKQYDIDLMEKAGALTAQAFDYLEKFITPGISTLDINTVMHEFVKMKGAIPAQLGFKGFPASVTTSVNDCYCHGLPNSNPLKSGDIVTVDIALAMNGHYSDSARTYIIGKGDSESEELIRIAKKATNEGIKVIKPGTSIGDIGYSISKYVENNGYYVFREMDGHGIGLRLHQEPYIKPFGIKGEGYKLREGECITVEPIISAASIDPVARRIPNSNVLVYYSKQGFLSAYFEHTILVTNQGYKILTA